MDENMKIELKPQFDFDSECEKVELEILKPTDEVDARLDEIEGKIADLDITIDKLTNHADGLDYTVAVASGILTGLIDSFFVGKIDLKECHEYGNGKIEDIVKKVGKNDDLEKAIKNLEEKTKNFFPSDPNLNDFGGGRQHHLRDFAHHPTLVGLVCSLLTQFTEQCYGTDTSGVFLVVPVKDKSRIGDTLPKKIIYGTLYWFIHLVSDMAGSSGHAGGGTGLPGPILSLAKELSALPFFKKMNKDGNKEISVFVSKIFNGTFFAEKDASGKIIKESVIPIDLRTEIGILHKQALPVIINECIVRAFYSIRRFGMELKEHPVSEFKDLKQLNWETILPFGNRTIERMMTIATGTFTAIDTLDAVIEGAIHSKANWAEFGRQVVLRLNFVGIGRFTIALGTDAFMGLRKGKKSRERMLLKAESLYLLEAKMYYGDKLMWAAVQDAGQSVDSLFEAMQKLSTQVTEDMKAAQGSIREIENIDVSAIDANNKGLTTEIFDIL